MYGVGGLDDVLGLAFLWVEVPEVPCVTLSCREAWQNMSASAENHVQAMLIIVAHIKTPCLQAIGLSYATSQYTNFSPTRPTISHTRVQRHIRVARRQSRGLSSTNRCISPGNRRVSIVIGLLSR